MSNVVINPYSFGGASFPNTYSLNFDGVDDKVIVGKHNYLDGSGTMTISAWINPQDAGSYNIVLQRCNSVGCNVWSQADFSIYYNTDIGGGDSRIEFNIGQGTRYARKTGASFLSIDTWYHVFACMDTALGTTEWLKLYINGNPEAVANNPNSNVITAGTEDVIIGKGQYGCDAIIDEVAIWDTDQRANIAEIWDGTGKPTDLSAITTPPNTWYRMGDSGTYFNGNWEIPDQLKIDNFSSHSFNFDGIDDYVDCGVISAFDDGDITFSLWCNLTDTGTFQYILSTTNSSTVSGINIAVATSGLLYFERSQDSANLENYTSFYVVTGFTFGNWHHLAGIYNAGTGELKTYVDGVLKTTTADSADTRGASTALKIGGLSASGLYPTSGNIDEVSIFNSVKAIGDLWDGSGKPTDLSAESGLVGYWRMGEGATWDAGASEWTVPDDSTNSNDGTSSGMDEEDKQNNAPDNINQGLSSGMGETTPSGRDTDVP